MFGTIATFFMGKFSQMGYTGIIVLMTIESSFIPFPSEIVIPPAAYLASQGQMNLFLVIASGVAGSLIGALINYFLAVWLGRSLVYKLADTKLVHMMLIDRGKIEKAEEYFNKYGNMSTLIGRLIPAIRQLISIPAGLARMDLKRFIFFTTLGAGVWNVILALLGYYFGENKALLHLYYEEIKIGIILVVIAAAIFIIVRYFYKKNKSLKTDKKSFTKNEHL
ncbi:MAG TPA: DedA family protein [Candidatus Cloacimonadota bacterium]|jgi:membrane protein DedA with SNARE-associated domain|nr:DedA family protein [Candidatus Cloacimonadota bacterium]HQB40492.1 DedA family protein [Candidatus Cloacimonadota bacterium]